MAVHATDCAQVAKTGACDASRVAGLILVSILYYPAPRALCRIKLLPVTHVLVETWMLTVKPVYKLSNVSDYLKWTTNTYTTLFTLTFKA